MSEVTEKFFLIGICGMGMAPLATYLRQAGHTVYGFDNPTADNVYQRVVDKLQELFAELNAMKNTKA